MTDSNNEEKGFVIKDRRRFAADGSAETDTDRDDRPQTEQEPDQEPPREERAGKPADEAEPAGDEGEPSPDPASDEGQEAPAAEESGPSSRAMPKVDFSGFLFSLYASAAFHFGDMADPATGKKEKNLPAAQQMIDIIALLKEKTEGNLTAEEKGTIDALLYELRMRYVKES